MKLQSPKYNFHIEAFDKTILDITDRLTLRTILNEINPDIIVNTAAYTSVDQAEHNRDQAYKVNHLGVKNLAEICQEKSILLIHISTDYVFNGLKGEAYNENDETCPINIYGDSKLKGEQEIRSLWYKHIIIRTSWVFGVHGHNFIKTILNLIRANKDIKIVDDQYGCPTSARSLAECIYKICIKYSKHQEIEYGTFHFTNTPSTSWYLFATDIIKLAYKYKLVEDLRDIESISCEEYESQADRPMDSSLSTNKIFNSFNISDSEWKEELELTISKLSN
jgi:dTDP-4-dehydrorhamnose reductase